MMIPKNCADTSKAAQGLYNTLYEVLGPEYIVIQHLSLPENLKGSFLWVQHGQRSLFLYLSHATKDDFDLNKIENARPSDLVRNTEIMELLKLQKQLLPKQLITHKAQLVPLLIVFPNISKKKLSIGIRSKGLYLLSSGFLKADKLGSLIHKLLGEAYSQKVHNYIRHIFSPETLISTQKNIELSQIGKHLLDVDQEIAMKADIILSENLKRTNNCNLTGINGGPSSGKSEALIRRAKLIRQFHPEKSILILTLNKASQKSLKKRYTDISPQDKKTVVLCINEWCQQRLIVSNKLVHTDDVVEIIESKIIPILKENGLSLSVFLHELNFIHGRAIFYEKDYVEKTQTSQPYHLSKEHYPLIWKAVLTLKNELSTRGFTLWSELPQLLWDSLQSNLFNDSYDHILVDNSHHLPPIAFDLLRKMLEPKSGQLFITQDPNQGVINPCSLWKDTGFDLRNHSSRLNRSYEINPYILNAANALYLKRLPEEMDKHILQNLPITIDKPIPELLHFHTKKDEENRLLNEVKHHIKIGQNLQDILIVTNNKETTQYIANLIKETLETTVDILADAQMQNNHHRSGIGICSFMETQGLTASFVFIFGIQDLLDSEKNIEHGTSGHQALVIENTKKLSNTMTRARKKLTLFITADKIPDDFISPHIKIPTANTSSNAEIRYLSNSG